MRWGSLFLVLGLTACADASSSIPPVGQPAPADVLDVACDGSTTTVADTAVQAHTDGVHLRVHNASDENLSVQWNSGGDGADPGDSTLVFAILPGEGRVRCQRISEDAGAPGGWATFRVVASPGWVSPELRCTGGRKEEFRDFVAGATGVSDPLAHAQRQAQGLEVQQAGYRTEVEVTFVGFDDGVPTHSYDYASDAQGGWLLHHTSACD